MTCKTKLAQILDYAVPLVISAGEIVKARNFNVCKIQQKSYKNDLVTESDVEVENFLRKNLLEKYPTHHIVGEESTALDSKVNFTADPTWIIDPIDGTLNYVHNFPHSCISVGFAIDYEPVLGIIYNPVINQLFTACKDEGAYLNGKKIKVSSTQRGKDALIMFAFNFSGGTEKYETKVENFKRLVPIVHGMRNLGSAALHMAMVAMGSADAYFETGIHLWDIAAGEIIVKEAGGVVLDPSGGPIDRLSRRVLCASTQELAIELSSTIVQHYPKVRD